MKEKLYYHNKDCSHVATEAEWNSVYVYDWFIKNKNIIFFRCPKCKSDITKQSLKIYQIDR